MSRNKKAYKIGVVGAGSWGTALARLLAVNGYPVELWSYEEEIADQINRDRENKIFLPGVPLPVSIEPTTRLSTVLEQKDLLVLAVPSHFFRNVLNQMMSFLSQIKKDCLWITATKGIENDTLLTMSGVLKELLPPEYHSFIGCLSGPTFAKEVSRDLPTAVSLASGVEKTALTAQRFLSNTTFRVYTNLDLLGVELGGALKNVIALAAGISDGLQLGHNARAALITRGLAEICRLGEKMGASRPTFFGLAGIGDLVLTCTGDLSRNRTVGLRLGQGEKLAAILSTMTMVAEGIKTTRAAHQLAIREKIEMPIVSQIYGILYEGWDPRQAVKDLMTRDLKAEG
ncbi:MAG: NAD(P)-dependent glycerol-3-phosphate dehydrogenase [Deltaproteobacteria bacterium]|nr:NAD(P)-dependent glycerol-3-phosphate dehydrogenase [Deltaproteobacteria bacterium]